MEFARLFESMAAHGPLVYFGYCLTSRRVLYVSPSYERELGGHVATVNEELPGWWAQLHLDDRRYLAQRVDEALAGKPVEGTMLRFARPDGGTRWLCLTMTTGAGEDEARPLLSGYVQDVTGTQAVLENAQRYQAKKDSMLEILSHDLASPLVLVEQMTDYLTERVGHLADAHLNHLLDVMRQACQEGVKLIRDFVAQEFLDSANVDLVRVRLDLTERLGLVLDNYQQRQHTAGHRFLFESSHPSIYAEVDENKFLQVINNLLGNAMKFTPDGGHIRVSVSQHPYHVLVTVADDGVGIPTALQAGLFERFTKARRPGLRGEKSTGLGMSIIKTIVELHRGRIWVESQEGQGSTFYIQLPLLAA